MNNQQKYMDFIRHKLEFRDVLEGIAEEAAELNQAALKLIRAKHLSKNVTPISDMQASTNFFEEYIDILIMLSLYIPVECMLNGVEKSPKWERWAKRLGYVEELQDGNNH